MLKSAQQIAETNTTIASLTAELAKAKIEAQRCADGWDSTVATIRSLTAERDELKAAWIADAGLRAERDALKARNETLETLFSVANQDTVLAKLEREALTADLVLATAKAVVSTDSWRTFCYELGAVGWAAELRQASDQLVYLANQLSAAESARDLAIVDRGCALVDLQSEIRFRLAICSALGIAPDLSLEEVEGSIVSLIESRDLAVAKLGEALAELDSERRMRMALETECAASFHRANSAEQALRVLREAATEAVDAWSGPDGPDEGSRWGSARDALVKALEATKGG